MASLYALWAWLFAALGLSWAVVGPALPALRAEFEVPLAASGLLFVCYSAGYLAGVLAAGALADARGRRPVTAAGVVGLAAGMALGAVAPNWPLLLGAMVVAGWGFAFIDVGLNAAIGDAMPEAGRRAAAMNLLHAAFPVGTLLAPAGLALSLQLGLGWRAAFLATGVTTGAALLGFWRSTGWPRVAPPAGQEAGGELPDALGEGGGPATQAAPAGRSRDRGLLRLLRLLREPGLRRLALIQGLYVGVEAALAGWLATYLVEQFGTDPAAGALATSAYWAGFLAGRPVIAYLTHRYGPQRVLSHLFVAAIAAAVAGVWAPGPFVAAGAFALTGLAISGVFPTAMALALEGRRDDAGAVAGLIMAAAALGGLTWPWLVGGVAQAAGARPAMATASAPLVAMLALSLWPSRSVPAMAGRAPQSA